MNFLAISGLREHLKAEAKVCGTGGGSEATGLTSSQKTSGDSVRGFVAKLSTTHLLDFGFQG